MGTMIDFLRILGTNVVVLLVFVAVVAVALKVVQSMFGTESIKSTVVEASARLTTLPTATTSALRRRFAKSLTSQYLIMPSGERHAFAHLTIRIAPEDRAKLAPESDLAMLGRDGARLYLKHAQRQQWRVPNEVTVTVEVDPVLRPGWIPPARGTHVPSASDAVREDGSRGEPSAWDLAERSVLNLSSQAPGPTPERFTPERFTPERFTPERFTSERGAVENSAPATMALVPSGTDHPTVTVDQGDTLSVSVDGRETTLRTGAVYILGRAAESVVTFEAPEVSGRHLAIRHTRNGLRGARWEVKDLGSTNGTELDGRRLEPHAWNPIDEHSNLVVAGVNVAIARPDQGTLAVAGLAAPRTS
jgi:hypothetical protein